MESEPRNVTAALIVSGVKCIRYKSTIEAAFANVACALLADEYQCRVIRLEYEPLTFNLPGNRYTPDFYALLEDGRVALIEVKASRRQKNYRDARAKLRLAAQLFPEFVWTEALVTLRRGGIVGVKLETINK